jgi:HK97 gp10 family phage protein
MAKRDVVEVIGLEEIEKILEELAPKHARNLSRALIHSLASTTAKEAKKKVPVDKGNLKKAIKAKRKRSTPDKPVSDVEIEQGKSVKNDGFYWHMVEYGTGGPVPQPEQPFLRPARDYVEANMPRIVDEQFKKKLVAAINREKKKAAKK